MVAERLEPTCTSNSVWPSFLGTKWFRVFRPTSDGSLKVLAVNDLNDLSYATPAIADGRLYVRTRATLYCFGLR